MCIRDSFTAIDGDVIIKKDAAAHPDHTDGFGSDVVKVDRLGNKTVYHPVVTTGTEVKRVRQ